MVSRLPAFFCDEKHTHISSRVNIHIYTNTHEKGGGVGWGWNGVNFNLRLNDGDGRIVECAPGGKKLHSQTVSK
jgi:hypothetical protein